MKGWTLAGSTVRLQRDVTTNVMRRMRSKERGNKTAERTARKRHEREGKGEKECHVA